MSVWWDADAGRYRSTLVHKLLFVWGWPAIRWALFLLPPEAAHHVAIRGIGVAGWVDRVWGWVTHAGALLVLLAIRALLLLPWFTCEPPQAEERGGKYGA